MVIPNKQTEDDDDDDGNDDDDAGHGDHEADDGHSEGGFGDFLCDDGDSHGDADIYHILLRIDWHFPLLKGLPGPYKTINLPLFGFTSMTSLYKSVKG